MSGRSLSSRDSAKYLFSNDSWDSPTVNRFISLLARQPHRPEATAVVVGAGGLPYTLGYLGVSRVVVADKYEEVGRSVRARAQLLGIETITPTWEEHLRQVKLFFPGFETLIDEEFQTAKQSGLMRNYDATQEGAAATEIALCPGDIVETFPVLGASLKEEDRKVTMVNISNVAGYMLVNGSNDRDAVHSALADLVCQLPLTPDAVIVESTRATVHDPMRVSVGNPADMLGRLVK
ncbi:MAG TPA: hypothetical protein VLF71_01810 [Candidatus Saccharimonadales bacterium]|nr:hypothetical protein [Candidatus Saccharimonadales bacterium]